MSTRRSLPALLAGAVFLVALAASATGQIPTHVRRWSARVEGAVAADPKTSGRLWLGGDSGLVRHDTGTGD